MLPTALHLPPAFSQSARVVNCAMESVLPDAPDDTPEEVPLLPVDGLADGEVPRSVDDPLDGADEPLDGAEAPVPDELEESLPVVPVAPVVPEVPVLPAPELPVVPAAPLELPLLPEPPVA